MPQNSRGQRPGWPPPAGTASPTAIRWHCSPAMSPPLLTEAVLTIGGTLRAFRYAARPYGSHGACMVTSHRGQETETG